jgi:stearoyl-CoA desaturase (Delta-9 desaturase)
MGWILRDYPSGVNDFTNAKDLERDPIVMFQHRFYLPLTLAMNIGLPLGLGWAVGDVWGVFLLGGLLRLVLNHHFTWFINSLAHMWGTQPYTDENTARDNPVLAFLTYGEGYHNFHHIFQNDYRNGVKWWQFDPTKWLIAFMSWVGLASNLKRVPDLTIQRAQLAMQFKRVERGARDARARFGDEQVERVEGARRRGIRGVQEGRSTSGRRCATVGGRPQAAPAAEVGRDQLPPAAQADRAGLCACSAGGCGR